MISFLGCQEKKTERVSGDTEIGSSVAIRNFHRESFSEEGVVNWKLDADESYVFAETGKTVLYKFRFEQMVDGKTDSIVTSDKGILDNSEDSLVLEGDIVMNTSDNRVLKTEKLVYDLEEKTLSSDADVVVYSEGTTIYGKGLRADSNLKKFTILKPEAITREGNPFKKND